MKISAKGRYAVRLMIDLAEHDEGKYISLKEISKRQGISIKYLEQIVVILGRAGFVKSVRGAQGGYRLSRKPAEYTIGEILRLIEGPLVPVSCLEDLQNECPRQETCPTLSFWEGLQKTINEYVDSYTLEDLVTQHQDACAWNFII